MSNPAHGFSLRTRRSGNLSAGPAPEGASDSGPLLVFRAAPRPGGLASLSVRLGSARSKLPPKVSLRSPRPSPLPQIPCPPSPSLPSALLPCPPDVLVCPALSPARRKRKGEAGLIYHPRPPQAG